MADSAAGAGVGAGAGAAIGATAGASPAGAATTRDNTPLHLAALAGNKERVCELLASGAACVPNEFGMLPEEVASDNEIKSLLTGA
mgnify:CR=1 FL=1